MTTDDQLIRRIGDTIMWSTLRDYITTLHDCTYEEQSFLNREWPEGGVPRVVQDAVHQQRAATLATLLTDALEALYSLGRQSPDLNDQARAVGVELPGHLINGSEL